MSENAIDENEMIPSDNDFYVDVSGLDTKTPLVAKTDKALLTITKAEVKENKDKTGRNLVIYLKNAEVLVTDEGVAVAPMEVLFSKYFPLQANTKRAGDEGYDADGFRKNIAKTLDAIFGTDVENRPAFNRETVDAMKGYQVYARITIDEPKPDDLDKGYGPRNGIGDFKQVK